MHDRSRGSLEQLGELMAKEVTALERLFDIALELGLVLDHQLRGLLVERVIGLGSKNSVIKPKNTEPRVNTGFQSARRMFKQTRPFQSMFG
jgi:hypothetical protein